jgi:phospholipid/cholesterol/gamma-HCH transport system substrate-binding protein
MRLSGALDRFGGTLPSQQQLRWAQLRVGLTVIIASAVLAMLIFLLTGNVGLGHKIEHKAYFDNAGGLRVGAPVRLHGVDIGNVSGIRVVASRKQTPVEVTMKVNTKYDDLRKDSTAALSTAGVLGETFVDIDSSRATGAMAQNGDTLASFEQPDVQDVMRSTQGTLQNMQALLTRADRILGFVESGQGSIGKLIYDDTLYKRLDSTVSELQGVSNAISQGKGTVGKLIMSDELYNKANASVDKLNRIAEELNNGQGTAGKFLKDPSLYNNANQTIARANQLLADINSGKGAIGMLATDKAFARKLDDTVTKLNLLSDKLNNGQGSAGRFINDPSLYRNTDQLLVETRGLIQAVRQNPKRYLTIHLKLF